ncbi:hypothetical protein [Methylobacter psychrophilus]|uniref:hypothetical protein n=1 Tax=Methylobacter psychrophilus TaxID=96941 RepID=UPI0021D50743|nr:hypothetical protein [Methylobacter psychrophilus]
MGYKIIVIPIPERTEKPQWMKLKCPECRVGTFYILAEWKKPPRYCDTCRAHKVGHKERALRHYFKNLRSKKILTDEDNKELIILEALEKRLDQLIKIHGENEFKIFEELIHIKKVRIILIKKEKEVGISRPTHRKIHKVNLGNDSGNKFNSFVQGGSPGLGKKA